jgi:DNA (cytosine-5)-methyltransferase 1
VAQRRRRVFVVGYLGDWRHPAKVLFESESVRRDTPPSREAREETAKCLAAGVGKRYDPETETLPVAFDWQSGGDSRGLDPKDTAMLQRNQVPAVATAMQVRRLTPVECERLQGFPDGYTNIPWRKKPESPDGPRYKALGNSMAVPVMRWIGERINKVDSE